jgi:hypothetical protein
VDENREVFVQRSLVAWDLGARLADMVNVSELLINIVSIVVPKLLGTDQNGKRPVLPLDPRDTSSKRRR